MKKYSIRVSQYDLDGNLVAEYNSVQEASEKTGINRHTIYYQIKYSKGTNKNKHKYTWKASNNDTKSN